MVALRWSLKFGGETRGADEIEGELFGDGGGSGSDFVYDVLWRGKWVGFESKNFSIRKWGKRVKQRHFKDLTRSC